MPQGPTTSTRPRAVEPAWSRTVSLVVVRSLVVVFLFPLVLGAGTTSNNNTKREAAAAMIITRHVAARHSGRRMISWRPCHYDGGMTANSLCYQHSCQVLRQHGYVAGRRQQLAASSMTSRRMLALSSTSDGQEQGDKPPSVTSSEDNDKYRSPSRRTRKIAVLGGGLAGLSTVYHLLDQWNNNDNTGSLLDIVVYDKAATVGTGGASAVAGGLIHPLSPRGKYVHWGLDGMRATRQLVEAAGAAAAAQTTNDEATMIDQHEIVLCDEILRLATTPAHVEQLRQTAVATQQQHSSCDGDDSAIFKCEWLNEAEVMRTYFNDECNDEQQRILGALRMSGSGCKVIHVPSYLKGLWLACQQLAESKASRLEWKQVRDEESAGVDLMMPSVPTRLVAGQHHAVVLAGGAGMFQDNMLSLDAFPSQLVGGQSIELRLPPRSNAAKAKMLPDNAALLCGKYVSPLPKNHRRAERKDTVNNPDGLFLVGATHEFQSKPMTEAQVLGELQSKTSGWLPKSVWEHCTTERLTSGFRVQSQRGKYGRRPMIGRLAAQPVIVPSSAAGKPDQAENSSTSFWLFTGLSSRGLLYHAVYGGILAKAILDNDEASMLERCPGILWWRDQ